MTTAGGPRGPALCRGPRIEGERGPRPWPPWPHRTGLPLRGPTDPPQHTLRMPEVSPQTHYGRWYIRLHE